MNRRLFWTVFLVAGIPIVVILWTFLKEVVDIGAMDRQNPLNDVAASLFERLDTRLREADAAVARIGAALVLSPAAAEPPLTDYAAYVDGGAFLALARVTATGRVSTYPDPLPTALSAWTPEGQAVGISALLPLSGGEQGVAMAAPVAGSAGGPDAARGRVVGLFNVNTVLGRDEVARMRVAVGGEAFVADGDGRIILSANPYLTGRTVSALGFGVAASENGARWTSPDGVPHLVGMAQNPGWYEGPHRAWVVGLVAPESALLTRNADMRRKVALVMALVILVSIAMVAVLRRSVGGRRR